MKITDEIVEKAAKILAERLIAFDWKYYADDARAALAAVLPDIEKEIREECAKEVDAVFIDETHPGWSKKKPEIVHFRYFANCSDVIISRSFPPSTQQEGK